ncbi:enoyl-CoA hydratase-like protein [Eremomyces bilateralis CBS 781.70]|uniref:Enoyl-CoA hydratase-like protein n=1 Tax=Eremomyces bilateralis CBS 781.70 TaxID=1392243 RepID=A0A6G1GCE6_9PEZI|nr:enoyl-CoA hydratase-like protein [Eremomyces bilateralis CBS 781.70]KAF1815703.1 enoyl-CoA hydratase-like protein [Eremomyces bilateralis CBS 781.70]
MTWTPSTPPPAIPSSSFALSYPAPHILLVTITREKAMNSIPSFAHWEADDVFRWFDDEPDLRVAIITGAGTRSFCAGQDLIEQGHIKGGKASSSDRALATHPASGFAGVSRRVGKKPVLAAVNGWALGGGFEIVLNCDMVVAAPTAKFGLPEALRGLYAAAGGLPRIVRNVGIPLASEIAMTGRQLTAEEALRFNLINRIAQSQATVVSEAVELAQKIAALSPDAVIVTRAGLREAWETASVEGAARVTSEQYGAKLMKGDNIRIGLAAFAQKKQPKWVPSKL